MMRSQMKPNWFEFRIPIYLLLWTEIKAKSIAQKAAWPKPEPVHFCLHELKQI